MKAKRVFVAAVWIAILTVPMVSLAQHQDLAQDQPAVPDATVDFGVLAFPATTPLGPPPCLQEGGIGGGGDPCAYKIHHLVPEEVTIVKGGEVTFQVHGNGHSMAIYEVTKDTTRDGIGQFLCPGDDPATITNPAFHACNLDATNAAARHLIEDGHGDVVIVAAANVTNVHPDNRVWSVPGRLMSAGGHQTLNGGTLPAGPTSNGQLVTYRFLKAGRYLVICMNRTHFLNDWMFGFVNVT